jgi:hypothetical protein
MLALLGLVFWNTSIANDVPKLPVVDLPTFKKDTFNIIKYGAKPDGT